MRSGATSIALGMSVPMTGRPASSRTSHNGVARSVTATMLIASLARLRNQREPFTINLPARTEAVVGTHFSGEGVGVDANLPVVDGLVRRLFDLA